MNAFCIPLVILTIKKRVAVESGKVEVPHAH